MSSTNRSTIGRRNVKAKAINKLQVVVRDDATEGKKKKKRAKLEETRREMPDKCPVNWPEHARTE